MIFNLHLISVLMDNHLLIGDLNNQRKRKFNVSHVICEITFITIYLLFSNLNLYRQRISFFLLPLVSFPTGISLFFLRLIVFFSLWFSLLLLLLMLFSIFFSLSPCRQSTFTHAGTMSRLFVDSLRLVIMGMCYQQHKYRRLTFLYSFSSFLLCSLNSFSFLCVCYMRNSNLKIEFIQ